MDPFSARFYLHAIRLHSSRSSFATLLLLQEVDKRRLSGRKLATRGGMFGSGHWRQKEEAKEVDPEVELTHILHSSCHVFTVHVTYRVVLHVNFFCSIARADLMHTHYTSHFHMHTIARSTTPRHFAASSNCVNLVHLCIALH